MEAGSPAATQASNSPDHDHSCVRAAARLPSTPLLDGALSLRSGCAWLLKEGPPALWISSGQQYVLTLELGFQCVRSSRTGTRLSYPAGQASSAGRVPGSAHLGVRRPGSVPPFACRGPCALTLAQGTLPWLTPAPVPAQATLSSQQSPSQAGGSWLTGSLQSFI